MKRIAIIGSGISGLGAAYALKDVADVTVFEARDRAGGHAHTVDVDYNGKQLSVDVGFIVYNGQNYPNLTGLFEALDVETQASDMSFAVSNPHGYEWASTASGIFAQKRNVLNPKFHRFWRTILKFNDTARNEHEAGMVDNVSLGVWLDQHGFDSEFRDNYILPMAAAIWSTPERNVLDFPATSFFSFFENHRLMHKERPHWRTVTGGSRSYVRKLEVILGPRLRTGTSVTRIARFGDHVRVELAGGCSEVFDEIIIATHSDQARAMLGNDFDSQRFLLGSARYRPNRIFLHCDTSLMPRRRRAWASWNVIKQDSDEICLTYWMNRLQNLPNRYPLFVTLNPDTPPAGDKTFLDFTFDHPQFDAPALAAVRSIQRMQGTDGVWFAGAWLGHGFHEDGLKSGLSAALSLGGRVPWPVANVEMITRDAPRQTVQIASSGV